VGEALSGNVIPVGVIAQCYLRADCIRQPTGNDDGIPWLSSHPAILGPQDGWRRLVLSANIHWEVATVAPRSLSRYTRVR